ncbi:U3 small nucleolar RNA-associated protein 11, partial [Phenoliferia sp. Uapishka_3]
MVAGKLDLQKRQHRERAQPLKRQRLGLLEKHADYVKRARDFHSKEDRIKKLREKAAGRNKDEFYFGMIKARTSKGVHMQSRGNEVLSNDLVKVLKTQDAGYIRTHKAIEQSRVDRLQQRINSLIETGVVPAAMDEDADEWDSFDAVPSTSATPPARQHILFCSNLDIVRSADPSTLLSKRPRTSVSSETASARRSRKGKAKADPVDPAIAAAEEASREAATA